MLSALLPTRHSRHRSRDSYDDDSCRYNRIQRRLAQERIAQERLAQENMTQENVAYRNPAVSSECDIASAFARSSTSHDEKRGDARNNFEAFAGALVSLAVASVARVIDSVLPGFQREYTRGKTGPAYRGKNRAIRTYRKKPKPEEDYLSGLLRFAASRSY